MTRLETHTRLEPRTSLWRLGATAVLVVVLVIVMFFCE